MDLNFDFAKLKLLPRAVALADLPAKECSSLLEIRHILQLEIILKLKNLVLLCHNEHILKGKAQYS